MSYPKIDDGDFLTDLLRRKEIYSLKADPDNNFRDPADGKDDVLAGKYLKLRSHQLFVRNLVNPNTPYKRLHLMHATGAGKTLAAIAIAQEFITVYKKLYAVNSAKSRGGKRNYTELSNSTPTVFVLGFGGTKGAFIRELLKHPEFGFITVTEKEELLRRQKTADAGLPDDIKHLKEYYTQLKKRIQNKSRNGFYVFKGYDEFVNRLFPVGEGVKLTDLDAVQKLRTDGSTLEDVFREYIEAGKIQVNYQLLSMFENSLLICDEIHNTYNMDTKNNRGVAIQFILDYVRNLRFVSLSATPINNSPTEVVELVNYLVPSDKKITKKEFFSNSRTLYPGKLEEIGNITRGYISFLQDVNIKYYPRRVFIGETVKLPKDVGDFRAGDDIPYLKFIQCPMSEFHQITYNRHLQTVDDEPADAAADDEDVPVDTGESVVKYSYHSIPTDGYSIYDIVFPNPDSDEYGIFKSSDIRSKISSASVEWKDKHKITMKKFLNTNNIIIGDFLHKDNIGYYSTKCKTLLDTIFSIIAESNGDPGQVQKIMIYHDRKIMSGALLLQELLRANNMLDEYSEPIDSTLCCVCGKALSEHKDDAHEYRPVRFIVAHSDIDKAAMDQSLAKYNTSDNSHGLKFMILIGSKIIKESYDFKDIQNLVIMSLPINIPTLLQVFGRSIRTNSHINLPPEQRHVKIRILISTNNERIPAADSISPEMYRYIDKLSDYIVIQKLEREFNRNAIDADIHRDIIMPPDLKKMYLPDGVGTPIDMLGNLYFEPAKTVPSYTLDDLNLSTFTAYKYYEEELRTISYIIKRLFMMQPVWTYDTLWARVRNPPIGVEINPKLFMENNFIIALHNLVDKATTIVSASKQRREVTTTMLIDQLFDYNERYIYINGGRHKIEQVGKYYIMFPMANFSTNPLNVVHAEYFENIRDKERAMIKTLIEPTNRVLVDVETYARGVPPRTGLRINIDTFVRESKANINYVTKKNQFAAAYKEREDVTDFLSDYSAAFQMSFVEEAIAFAMIGGDAADDISSLYTKVLQLMDKLDVLIYPREVSKYKDTAKQYKNGIPAIDEAIPLGYMTSKTIRLFDPDAVGVQWIEISKISMNRHMSFKENDIIVGYFETAEDYMKFKLRKPSQVIKEMRTKGDTRLIERGIVCDTKNKQDLLEAMAALGISVSSLDKADVRIRRLCEIIKARMIELEIKERGRKSMYKYLYSWWTEPVNLAAL